MTVVCILPLVVRSIPFFSKQMAESSETVDLDAQSVSWPACQLEEVVVESLAIRESSPGRPPTEPASELCMCGRQSAPRQPQPQRVGCFKSNCPGTGGFFG